MFLIGMSFLYVLYDPYDCHDEKRDLQGCHHTSPPRYPRRLEIIVATCYIFQ